MIHKSVFAVLRENGGTVGKDKRLLAPIGTLDGITPTTKTVPQHVFENDMTLTKIILVDDRNKVTDPSILSSTDNTPVILRIDAKRMHEDGKTFFLSRNGVWLTEYVDVKYIKEQAKS